MTDYVYILEKRYSDKQWSHNGETTDYDGIEWNDVSPKPSKSDLDKEYSEYKKANDYKDLRKREYPLLNDLVVALWEKVVENDSVAADALQALRVAVKTKYPKP